MFAAVSLCVFQISEMTDQDTENLRLNDELGLRQPPPYPGPTKGWQQQPGTGASGVGDDALLCLF